MFVLNLFPNLFQMMSRWKGMVTKWLSHIPSEPAIYFHVFPYILTVRSGSKMSAVLSETETMCELDNTENIWNKTVEKYQLI